MIDSDEVPKQIAMKKKKAKRKERSNEEDREEEFERSPKNSRLNSSERDDREQLVEVEKGKLEVNAEGGCPWGNLQLILSLQNKNLDIPASVLLHLLLFLFIYENRNIHTLIICRYCTVEV